MRSIIINDNNLKDEDIDYSVTRVKAFIINSNGLLLVHNNNTYQFPGGHVEKGEDYKDTLIREIKEETVTGSESAENSFAQTLSTGSRSFTPFSSAFLIMSSA